MADTTHGATGSTLQVLTDQCVMCGLCLPHCPTYLLDRHEAESPRGRIALARQLATGALQPSAGAIAHLDHCLGCLSCQPVCPSNVRYDEILLATRALIAPMRPQRSRLRRWLSRPDVLRNLARLSAATQAHRWLPRLARLLPNGSLVQRLASEVPTAPAPWPLTRPTSAMLPTRGRLALFSGCVATVFDRDTLIAGRILLEALGFEVVEPAGSVCCGALALHAGEPQAAAATAQATREALIACDASTVLVSASGCLGSLRDHSMRGSDLHIADIAGFLAQDAGFKGLRFRPLPQRAVLHLACTQVNVGSGGQALRTLLARIPGLTLLTLPNQPRCCGAAGNHFLEFPERADRLRTDHLEQITALTPDLLLTTNIGCRIFLGNGLRQRKSAIPTLHPLALLARQLETALS